MSYTMCWNQHVSINTFVFGIFCLVLIAYNNTYSKYKTKFFKNRYAYLFMLSFLFMQLFEFILWRNLKNERINHVVSLLGVILVGSQPIASLFLLDNIPLRNTLLVLYSVPAAMFMVYTMWSTNIHTTLSPSHHLKWNWELGWMIGPYFLFFLFFSLVYNQYYLFLIFLLLYFIFLCYFGKDGSYNSIWCLSINSIFFYFLINLLVIMPYYETVTAL
jgi:hypothetical protein